MGRSIAGAACLFATINSLYGVGPDLMKDSIVSVSGVRFAKHALVVVLVKL
jgi:hypothetical protein